MLPSAQDRATRSKLHDHDDISADIRTKLADLELRIQHEHLDSGDSSFDARLRKLESKIGSDTYKMHSKSFGSLFELEQWVESTQVPSCGYFWDLFSALVAMNQDKGLTGKGRSDNTYSAQRTKSTRFENSLVASFTHDWPTCCFSGSDDAVVTKEGGFTTCTSFSSWIGMSTPKAHKDILTDRLSNFILGVQGHLDRLQQDQAWVPFASQLLTNVTTQFAALCAFIERFYQSLVSVSRFPADRAWKLVGRCVGAIFELQVPQRSRAQMLDDASLLENKAAIIGTVLKGHAVLTEFTDLKFNAHPALVKEMSLFMLTERVDPDEVQTLKTTVQELKTQVIAMKRTVDKSADQYTELNKRHGDLNASFLQYKADQKRANQSGGRNRGSSGTSSANMTPP